GEEVASTLIKTLRCEWIHGFIADFFNTIGGLQTGRFRHWIAGSGHSHCYQGSSNADAGRVRSHLQASSPCGTTAGTSLLRAFGQGIGLLLGNAASAHHLAPCEDSGIGQISSDAGGIVGRRAAESGRAGGGGGIGGGGGKTEAQGPKARRKHLGKVGGGHRQAMIARGGNATNDQDILAYFTRPTRTVNHRLIGEIRSGAKHKDVKAADEEDLNAFISAWPDVDYDTGLSRRGDELLIKARESMIAAVHVFNSAGLTFRAELFIVTAVIAWTYLLHAWFKREGVDYRYAAEKTKEGADKYWELGHCLKQGNCPAKGAVAKNLEFLLAIRHEIEHRSTNRIDDALGAKLQACAINFNDAVDPIDDGSKERTAGSGQIWLTELM
ncbi:DUF3644 domain-containing protein, partial [Mesorhizobium sp. M0185]|uniref:DUF3644 domain-containing protein n=1 Tax=Mesorhizobium sp. M0185 TaxID=2956907 RepID=UPI003338657D